MRIDMKRQAEVSKRQGLANKTTLAILAFVIGFVVAYLGTSYLFSAEILSVNFFYKELFIPDTVSEGVIRVALALLLVFFLQFMGIIAYALASPSAKVRPGTPTALARDPDYYEVYSYTD
jgi:hypothetical protein